MMRNKITTEELIKNRLTPEETQDLINEAENEIKEIKWGGKRQNSGRRPLNGQVLSFTKRLTEKEARFIDYAREHHINYDDLMQG